MSILVVIPKFGDDFKQKIIILLAVLFVKIDFLLDRLGGFFLITNF